MSSTLKRMTVGSLSSDQQEYILENGPEDPKDMGMMGPFATTFGSCFKCHVTPQVMQGLVATLREREERKEHGGGRSTRRQKPPMYKVTRRKVMCN